MNKIWPILILIMLILISFGMDSGTNTAGGGDRKQMSVADTPSSGIIVRPAPAMFHRNISIY